MKHECVNKPNCDWLYSRPIAHRGYHGLNVMENSLLAYQKAIDKGYNIEIDVHRLADGELAVFHDNNLKRIFGDGVELTDLTYDQLCKYTLPFVDERIPTLKQVLDFVDGRTGLLIEIKTYIRTDVAKKMAAVLKDYKGEYAVQSFSPTALLWYKHHEPNVNIGILASDVLNFAMYWSKYIKPDFISYNISDLTDRKAEFLRERANKLLSWTVTNPILEERAKKYTDNIIFEGYELDR